MVRSELTTNSTIASRSNGECSFVYNISSNTNVPALVLKMYVIQYLTHAQTYIHAERGTLATLRGEDTHAYRAEDTHAYRAEDTHAYRAITIPTSMF